MMSNKSPQCAETIEYSVQTSRWRKTLIDKLHSIFDGFKRHNDAVIHETAVEFVKFTFIFSQRKKSIKIF